ncbi:replication-relaxation family protein [Streptomyces sp. NPDC005381]|uniref:replication-relaxation family protein n=1 Tax=Streptomyces sp. NPDC005381 TaxID=3364714 RepID=UPI0036C8F07C
MLAALGVLKLATADQMHRLMAPGHRDNKAFRNAALDLARHGLVVSEGSSRDGHKIWHLTPVGLDAAVEVLGRPVGEMGATARGAARSGAPHAMAVNETVIAITRTPATATRPVPRPQTTLTSAAETTGPVLVPPAEPSVAGIGWVGSWSTEVPLAAPSSRSGRAGVRADAVLTAPEADLPVLFVEVDNCTEPPETLEAKFEKYLRYFRLTTKCSVGDDMPLWRTRYRPSSREGHPPLVFVFNPGTRIGPQVLKNRMTTVLKGTRQVWSGDYQAGLGYGSSEERDGYWDFTDAIPVLFSTLDRLQAGGPHAAVWWRCGHRQWETLPDALDNPTDHRAWQAREKVRRARHDEELAQRKLARGRAAEKERWATKPLELEPVPEVAPCERGGLPITGQYGQDDAEFAPSEDGRHCPICRSDLRSQYSTLRSTLFGRRQRGK